MIRLSRWKRATTIARINLESRINPANVTSGTGAQHEARHPGHRGCPGPRTGANLTGCGLVSVDAYRDAGNADAYREIVRGLGRFGRPVAITEFGCCTYGGASSRGGNGWMIVDQQADPPSLNGDYRRDEGEQVRCFSDLMAIFDREGVDSAFWFTFAGFALPHREDPTFDLDMASYGVVAVSEPTRAGQGWREKQVFRAIAADYGRRHSLAASGAGAGTRAQAK